MKKINHPRPHPPTDTYHCSYQGADLYRHQLSDHLGMLFLSGLRQLVL